MLKTAESKSSSASPGPGKKRRTWLWVLGGIALVLALVIALAGPESEDSISPDLSKPTLTNRDLLSVRENPDDYRSHMVEFTGLVIAPRREGDRVEFQLSYGNHPVNVIFVDHIGAGKELLAEDSLVKVSGVMLGGVEAKNGQGDVGVFPKVRGMIVEPGEPDDLLIGTAAPSQ